MRILFVSRCNATGFSGGRYYAFLMAEAFAHAGHSVVYWANAQPSFWGDLSALPGHRRVKMHVADWGQKPEGQFDLVIIVPDMSEDQKMYEKGLAVAKASNARTMLINFESPNWFNSMSPAKRDESKWLFWKATARYSDIICSCVAESTKFAREFYAGLPAWTSFRHAYPSVNSAKADKVWNRRLPVKKQIICISRFGSAAAHKGINDVEVLAHESLRGYEIALIIGTGNLPKENVVREFCDKFEAVGMSVRFLHGISDEQKFEEIAQSSALVFPTYFEGFGYPPVEALYMGRPCITYDLPVLREVSGDNLVYVPPGDTEGLRAAVVETVRNTPTFGDPALREKILDTGSLDGFRDRMQAILSDMSNVGSAPAVQAYRGAFTEEDLEEQAGPEATEVPGLLAGHSADEKEILPPEQDVPSVKVAAFVSPAMVKPQSQPDTQNIDRAQEYTKLPDRAPEATEGISRSSGPARSGIWGKLVAAIERAQTDIFSIFFRSRTNVIQRLLARPGQRQRVHNAVVNTPDFHKELALLWLQDKGNQKLAFDMVDNMHTPPEVGRRMRESVIQKELDKNPDKIFVRSVSALKRNKAKWSDGLSDLFRSPANANFLFDGLLARTGEKVGESAVADALAHKPDDLFARSVSALRKSERKIDASIRKLHQSPKNADFILETLVKAAGKKLDDDAVVAALNEKPQDVFVRSALALASSGQHEEEGIAQLKDHPEHSRRLLRMLGEAIGSKIDEEALAHEIQKRPEIVFAHSVSVLSKEKFDSRSVLESVWDDPEKVQFLISTVLDGFSPGTKSSYYDILSDKLHSVAFEDAVFRARLIKRFLAGAKSEAEVSHLLSFWAEHLSAAEDKDVTSYATAIRRFVQIISEDTQLREMFAEEVIACQALLETALFALLKSGRLSERILDVLEDRALSSDHFYAELLSSPSQRVVLMKYLSDNSQVLVDGMRHLYGEEGFRKIWKVLTSIDDAHDKIAEQIILDKKLPDYIDVMSTTPTGARQLVAAVQKHQTFGEQVKVIADEAERLEAFAVDPVSRKRLYVMMQVFKIWRRLHPHLATRAKTEAAFREALQQVTVEKDIWPAIIDQVLDDSTLPLEGANLEVCTRDDLRILIQEILFNQEYYFETDKPAPLIIDGGANFGLAVYYFKSLYPAARIRAFEPGRRAYRALRNNVSNNNWHDVEVYPYALWSEEKTLEFSEPTEMTMAGTLTNRMAERGYECINYDVTARRLSDYIDEPVDFLKLDVEGAELGVLQELGDKLDLVSNLFVEIHGSPGSVSPNDVMIEIVALLEERGFEIRISQAAAGRSNIKPMNSVENRASLALWAKKA